MQRINPAYDLTPEQVARNHERFVQVLTSATPDEAERVVRGIIVSAGFGALGRSPPPGLGQLTHEQTGVIEK